VENEQKFKRKRFWEAKMNKTVLKGYSKNVTALALVWAMLMMPLLAFGQTRVSMPKNKYKVQDDVRLGQDAARQVEQQMPILNDYESTRYVQDVGRRLVNAIPAEFQQSQFQYSFKIVNARDINAFALPGGPMYVNRGMIEAAQNEGEMAGVMAHELSHVALRHGTAQATKQSSPLNQILGIGAILGGAVLGGQTGAAIGQTIYQGFLVNPYSREYETQADILGAQIMARAGYDPRDLANMFKTIERQSGGSRTPEWLSTHPNPGNRYATIEREAQLLRVSPEPLKITQGFQMTKRRLQGYSPAPTMAEIEQRGQTQTSGGGAIANGRYESRVEYPSSRMRSYNLGLATVNAPENWQVVNQSQNEIWFAPQGAYGNQGITRGALIGIQPGGSRNLQQDTETYVNNILQSNTYLQAQSRYSRVSLGGRSGLGIMLSGTSPVTGRTEVDTIYTTQLRNGDLFYVVAVSPQSESSNYNYAFRSMINSIRIND
jgi:Zn-dependent protease with chaperone function